MKAENDAARARYEAQNETFRIQSQSYDKRSWPFKGKPPEPPKY